MAKKCKKCGVALEGFLYRWIAAKVFGIRPSEKDPELCNKCEANTKENGCCCGCK